MSVIVSHDKTQLMKIEVAYAEPDTQIVLDLDLPIGTTVVQALALVDLPQVDIMNSQVGIFGRICGRDEALKEGDRVEIYRPLQVDAKEARRQRAEEQKTGSR